MPRIIQFTLLLLLTVIGNAAMAEIITVRESLPIGMLERIFPIRTGGGTGSCFVVDVEDRQYLITAKHVVSNVKAGEKVEILRHGTWLSIVFTPIFPQNEKIDAVAIPLESDLADRLDVPLGIGGIVLGQKVFFLGFPFGLASRSKHGKDFIPFVKAGVLSAIDYGDGETPIVYVDGHNNPGFSGGPIVFGNLNQKNQLQIAAVISGYRNQPTEVIDVAVEESPSTDRAIEGTAQPTTKKVQIVLENTGIVVGYQLDQLVDAIKKNPLGGKQPK